MEAERKEAEEKNRKEAERKAKYDRWGKGLVQAAAQATNVEDAMHEMSKPLTRHRDDQDLDAMLKDRVREEDPMLAFISKKKASKGEFGPGVFSWQWTFALRDTAGWDIRLLTGCATLLVCFYVNNFYTK